MGTLTPLLEHLTTYKITIALGSMVVLALWHYFHSGRYRKIRKATT